MTRLALKREAVMEALEIASLEMLMRQSLLTSFLLMMGATAPLTAQVHPNQFVELTAGFASSIGGDYEERTLYAFHLMGAQRTNIGIRWQ